MAGLRVHSKSCWMVVHLSEHIFIVAHTIKTKNKNMKNQLLFQNDNGRTKRIAEQFFFFELKSSHATFFLLYICVAGQKIVECAICCANTDKRTLMMMTETLNSISKCSHPFFSLHKCINLFMSAYTWSEPSDDQIPHFGSVFFFSSHQRWLEQKQ